MLIFPKGDQICFVDNKYYCYSQTPPSRIKEIKINENNYLESTDFFYIDLGLETSPSKKDKSTKRVCLTKGSDSQHLLLLKDYSSIIYLHLAYRIHFTVVPSNGDEIIDYKPFGQNRVILITKNGFINLLSYSPAVCSSSLLSQYLISLDREYGKEALGSLAVCDKSMTIAVFCSKDMVVNRRATRISIFRYEEEEIRLKHELSLNNAYMTQFVSFEFSHRSRNYLILSALESSQGNTFHTFLFDGDFLVDVSRLRKTINFSAGGVEDVEIQRLGSSLVVVSRSKCLIYRIEYLYRYQGIPFPLKD